MHNRERTPRLFAKLPGGEWARFSGESIPGVLAIVASQYQKSGKWSGTDYTLETNSAIVVQTLQPFDGFGSSWANLAAAITVLAGEYDSEKAAREVLPLVDSDKYRDAIASASASEMIARTLE